jgi:hypothetical protein
MCEKKIFNFIKNEVSAKNFKAKSIDKFKFYIKFSHFFYTFASVA